MRAQEAVNGERRRFLQAIAAAPAGMALGSIPLAPGASGAAGGA